jgi:radical SAM protein with 4Fe4S-binding SPASM domain
MSSLTPLRLANPPAPAGPVERPTSLDFRIISHYPQVREIRRGGMPFPRFAIIYPVYGCNLDCVGCEYVNDNEQGMTYLPLPRLTSLLDELADGGTEGVEFCGGGEPSLHPSLVDVVAHGSRRGLRFGILTNGTAVTRRFLEEALPHFAYVRVTCDAATEATYARVRPAKGPNPWQRVLENISTLIRNRKKGTEISLKFLVNRYNQGEIADAVLMARDLGADSIQFKAVRQDPAEITGDEAVRVDGAIAEARARFAPFPVLGSVGKLVMKRSCELTPLQVTIDARGDVFLCCYFTHRRERHRIGNVLEESFGKIWGSPRHREAIAAIQPHECSVFDCRFVRYHDTLDAWMGAGGDGLSFL